MRSSKSTVCALGVTCAWLFACSKTPAPDAAAPPPTAAQSEADSKGDAAQGVTLPASQIAKLGIVSSPVQSTQYVAEAAGFGVIESHDAIAQATAELATAQATLRLSHSALQRAQQLSGTPGAVSAEVEETAAQKEQIDSMALTLTTQKLSSTFGMNPPWKNGDRDRTLTALASGSIKLVRATFPLGRLAGGTPKILRAERIVPDKPGAGWKMTTVWDAPADGTIPGRSFFALLKADAAEGERLQVYAPIGESESGVVIPAAAAVMLDGKYWCYVEQKPGTFVRTEIDTSKPTADGYFVSAGIGVDARVVTASAGQLLAVESGSGAEPD